MAFKKFVGAGFRITFDGEAGSDARHREENTTSCRRQDLPDVLDALMSGSFPDGYGWQKVPDNLIPPAKKGEPRLVQAFQRYPLNGNKLFKIRVYQSDYVQCPIFVPDQVPDQKTNGISTSAPVSQSLS